MMKNKQIFATLPKTQRGMPMVLGADPKGENFVYCNGNSVIIRNIENPAFSDIYTEHSVATTVAKYSPSRFYIASADISGKIRLWDTVNPEHILKAEYQPFFGIVKDLAWSPDSQRIVVVGEGRERFGHVFMADTGTSTGEISGHGRPINSVDFKPSRPFRIITGSEDNSVGFFEGPPFKFKLTKQEHAKYVQCVRYSPGTGNHFASGGFDGKIFVFDGKTADLVQEIGSPAHSGGVYGVSWSPDGRQLLSCSGDKTCRLWDVETAQMVSEFPMGPSVEDQQVGCLWQGPYLLSVSLSGFITYLDKSNPSQPIRVVTGHNRPITALGLSQDKHTLLTGSHDGVVTQWDVASGENARVGGHGHGNQINDMVCVGDSIYTVGIDDSLRKVDLNAKEYDGGLEVRLGSQPRGVAESPSESGPLLVAACVDQVAVVVHGSKVGSLPIPYEASSISCSPKGPDVAVGGSDDKVHVYWLSGATLEPKTELQHLGAVTDVSYSPNGEFLAACDTHRKVVVYRLPEYTPAHRSEWGFHTGRVNAVAWSPDSRYLVSGGLDTNLIVWSMENPGKRIEFKGAHPMSQINKLAWLDNETVVSVAQDCNTKIWKIDSTA
ncbi:unnamed protein product [Cyprideis torosa]|uniref:Actin-interacting protein 1 n=1 Tax=Cyprideis torosa TaxID=163714 RepID=A0A7R8W5E2_9CRUS|nr:unnamed protein product [Cyprideis torosa]CAG0885086.1 unnamed protein product [Cyprideis torosa]